MEKLRFLVLLACLSTSSLLPSLLAQDMLITGVIDGPLPGGNPKAIEFYVLNDIPDLSLYGFGVSQNGGGSDGQEFTFFGTAAAGDYLYFAFSLNDGVQDFIDYLGFAPDFFSPDAPLNFNGNDAFELYFNGGIIDIFGEVTHGGAPGWEFTDGWVYRVASTGPDGGTFVAANWNVEGGVLTNSTINGGSGEPAWPVGTYGLPLPVTLTSFEVRAQGEQAHLRWETSRERQNHYFSVQRQGVDGSWQALGRVMGAGDAETRRVYSFVDASPLPGENAYRLQQVDLDGNQAFSAVRTLRMERHLMQAFPNPFRHQLHVQLPTADTKGGRLLIRDLQGRLVYEQSLHQVEGLFEVEVAKQLPAGSYVLQLWYGGKRAVLHLLKN